MFEHEVFHHLILLGEVVHLVEESNKRLQKITSDDYKKIIEN